MRTVKEIKAEIAVAKKHNDGTVRYCDYLEKLDCELRGALSASIALDRLTEICNAERDNRCYIAPCKVGSKVWLLEDGFGNPIEGEIDYWVTGKSGLIASIIFGAGQIIKIMQKRFGKTVFLTRAAAEAAKGGAE